MINEIITGPRAISPETAMDLQAALGVSAIKWLTWEAEKHQDRQARQHQANAIERRARLYPRGPVRDGAPARGWRRPPLTTNWRRSSPVCDAVRRSQGRASSQQLPRHRPMDGWTAAEEVWVCRARQLACEVDAADFAPASLPEALQKLRLLRQETDRVSHVTPVLASAGVKFLVVQPLGRDANRRGLFLGRGHAYHLSLARYDRIDNFWFVLLHELAHVREGDGKVGAPPLTATSKRPSRSGRLPAQRTANNALRPASRPC